MKATGLVLLVLATGCASTTPSLVNLSPERWAEEIRKRGVDLRDVPDPLAYTTTMREVAATMAGNGSPSERLLNLQRGLFDEAAFPFQYDHRGTFTAIEAFHRHEGNCLSFTNLFVALSRALGVPVTTALVRRTRASERDGDLIIVNNHVVAALQVGTRWEYYDFDRRSEERPTRADPLDDMWITALFLNNRGADELRAAHPDIALRYFLDATKLAPTFAPAWGNVGVARRRMGDVPGAFDAYRQALAIQADDPTILGNLAALYRSLGMEREAETALRTVKVTLATPHVLIVRGDLELAQGHTKAAIRLFKRAKNLAPRLADPLVALARAELARNRPAAARSDLERALHLEPQDPDATDLLTHLDAAQAKAPR
ncbi:MAG TPA: tetratricopeptide repeat protein [Thermoanaerobaculaceae bacterium]|nr:tetratricopeptide repeat protein [Thermoanaerobaculaceae bacterium]